MFDRLFKKPKVDTELEYNQSEQSFFALAQGLGIGVGGEAERDIRTYARQVINLHRAETDVQRGEVKVRIDETLRQLKTRPGQEQIGGAVTDLLFGEALLTREVD